MYTLNNFMNNIKDEWYEIIDEILNTSKDDKKEEEERKKINILLNALIKEYNIDKYIEPSFETIFNTFNEFQFNKLSVLIMYYRGENQDLREQNILEELYDEYKYLIKIPKHKFIDNYNFNKLKNQGVLITNMCLTYSKNNPQLHIELWNLFMPKIITEINKRQKYVIYLLWDQKLNPIMTEIKKGENDTTKKKTADEKRKIISYLILQAESLPKGKFNKFKGCNHFIITNHFLKNWHKPLIDWVSI